LLLIVSSVTTVQAGQRDYERVGTVTATTAAEHPLVLQEHLAGGQLQVTGKRNEQAGLGHGPSPDVVVTALASSLPPRCA
jgi:hypothetical protein